jgi:hypothetical protein
MKIATVNAQAKMVGNQKLYPHMYGDQGWHDFQPSSYSEGTDRLWYWSMRDEDRRMAPRTGWHAFLERHASDYPEHAFRAEFSLLREKVAGIENDTTSPDTRLSDDPLGFNPATVDELIHLVLGGLSPGNRGTVLHCRVRYFDPEAQRAGLPPQVAALAERLSADSTELRLVNLDQTRSRSVLVQSGGYAEHCCDSVEYGGRQISVRSPVFRVRLVPGSGGTLALRVHRYVNPPTLSLPWDH